jgi:putative Holliday junction resolvase
MIRDRRIVIGGPRLLGVDYGGRRIGLAVSDPTRTIAQGLPTLQVRGLNDAVKRVATEASRWDVREIVVGLPLTLSGRETEAARAVRGFVASLTRVTHIPVTFLDERFTSVIAERALRDMALRGRWRGEVDRLSATIILQTALDREARLRDMEAAAVESRFDDTGADEE